ncbi:hypothetical protein CR513_59780, partial [Mucuna pruriens]
MTRNLIEKTLSSIRKSKNMHIGHNNSSSVSSIIETNDFEINPNFADNPLYEPDLMENNNNRTLKELVTLYVLYQPWYLESAQTYELKFGLIHLLPKFHGLAGIPRGLLHDETARDPGGLHKDEGILVLSSWSNKRLVVSTAGDVHYMGGDEENVPREQHLGETLHEYWERFNKLCATCSHHQISEQLLLQYFYKRLLMMDQNMIDAVSGGALMDKTLVAARYLISNMASNTQQFGVRGGVGTEEAVLAKLAFPAKADFSG